MTLEPLPGSTAHLKDLKDLYRADVSWNTSSELSPCLQHLDIQDPPPPWIAPGSQVLGAGSKFELPLWPLLMKSRYPCSLY